MTFCLETERLLLRQFQDSDLESFLAYRNDPDVARYQGWNIPYPRQKGKEFIEFMTRAFPSAQGEWFQAALELKSTHEMVGDVGFVVQKDDGRQAYIGYSLARAHWGNGFAYEAVSRMLAYLFDELTLHRVVAECDVDNAPSWKLLERLGFRRESHLVENIFFKGAYGSEYHYAMLGREWKEYHSSRQGEVKTV